HAYQMYAHITWHTWKRVGCLDAAAASDVESAVTSACQASGVRVLRSAVLADHVHVVVSFRPDIRLSDFVRLAKSVAATRANRRIPGTVRWARGYFVTTIHKRDLPRVTRYVADQLQRHPDLIPRKSGRHRLPLPTPGASPGFTEGELVWAYRTPPMSRWTGLMSRNMTAAAPSVTAAVTPNSVGSGVVLMNPADQPASLLPSALERKNTPIMSPT